MTAMHSFRTWPLLLALALSACGGPMKKPADDYWLAADARNASAVESLVAYQAYVWTLSADDLAKESARVRDAAARDPGDFQRLRSAIAACGPSPVVPMVTATTSTRSWPFATSAFVPERMPPSM